MKKLAARDYEDLLQVRNFFLNSGLLTHTFYQCSILVFEYLLPKKEDRIVRRLLFELGTWHGLAKLRLHTETTVTDLENSATRLGSLLLKFKSDVCNNYATKDLPSEEAARGRRKAAKAFKAGGTGESVGNQSNTACGKQEGDWSSLHMHLHADAQPQMA